MDAGTGFEPVMHRAYETGVVTALPAIILADDVRFERTGQQHHPTD